MAFPSKEIEQYFKRCGFDASQAHKMTINIAAIFWETWVENKKEKFGKKEKINS